MKQYVLRWQYGVFAGETRTHYTYGSLDMLRHKANELSKDRKITYITIDEVKEVIKDIRVEVTQNLLNVDAFNWQYIQEFKSKF